MSDIEQSKGEMLLYSTADGEVKLDVRLENETMWMTQADMAQLFQTTPQNVTIHLKNIYEEEELLQEATCKESLQVRKEGERQVKRKKMFYNLDAIISVGYRVKSKIATQFRIWATKQLTEYIRKGFVMDDERLKNPPVGDSSIPDHFNEMLERIRDIRASERRMYLRVREIFAMAGDYNPTFKETTLFFKVIQNKLHFAATGLTAAELIQSRVNHALPNMGLTSWQKDEVSKTDVTIAKNYLKEDEIQELNRIVTMWLDYAEDQARRRQQVFMKDWEIKLDQFLEFNDRNVLGHAGSVSKKEADTLAKTEYDMFAQERRELKEAAGFEDAFNLLESVAKKLESEK